MKHKDQLAELTRLFLEEMKALRHHSEQGIIEPEPELEPVDKDPAEAAEVEINVTELGYPILPKSVMENMLTKSQYEDLLRGYLSQHYCEFTTLTVRSGHLHPN